MGNASLKTGITKVITENRGTWASLLKTFGMAIVTALLVADNKMQALMVIAIVFIPMAAIVLLLKRILIHRKNRKAAARNA